MKDFLGYIDEYLSTKRSYNFLRLFSPLKCMLCGEIEFSGEGPFCLECYDFFLQLKTERCPICACEKEDCKCYKIPGIKKHFFILWYQGKYVPEIISRVKYRGDKRYIAYMGKLLAEKIKEQSGKIKFNGICFVPRAKLTIKKVGFDQASLLAECVAYYLNLPVYHCIERKRDGSEQKKLSGEERRKNIKQKFKTSTSQLVNEHGEIHRRLLLIDDVVTTGATIQECAYILRKMGVSSVYVASIAKTPFRKRRKLIKKTKNL